MDPPDVDDRVALPFRRAAPSGGADCRRHRPAPADHGNAIEPSKSVQGCFSASTESAEAAVDDKETSHEIDVNGGTKRKSVLTR